MRWLDEAWRTGARWTAAGALGMLFLSAGCERKNGGPTPADDAAACAPVRDLAKRSLDRWLDLNNKGPDPNAPLAEAAAHAEALGKTAREIGADFKKAAPKRPDLADAAEGASMLGNLSGQKLDALARTVRDLDARIGSVTKLEGTANDAIDAIGKDIGANVGCGTGAPPACADVVAELKKLDNVRVPRGFAQAGQAARTRADTLDALAKAVDALPPAPPKAKSREETTRRAREAATAFRALGDALVAIAPLQERLANDRQDAEEAMTRLAVELEAGSNLCGTKPAGSASASAVPAPSAAPPANNH
ncbi:Hypothetical protein A7982_11501 [Minicystis rosea]|nr:Hypothetical protein A7982_11501 [Minicystis rosea]